MANKNGKYNNIQNYRKDKYNKICKTKYDANSNKIYFQSIDYDGSTIEHYCTYDENNNKTSYRNTKGYSEYYYYNENNILIKSIFHNPKYNDYITSIYDHRGLIIKKIIEDSSTVTIMNIDPFNTSKNNQEVFTKIFTY